jgi:hypothetical protein
MTVNLVSNNKNAQPPHRQYDATLYTDGLDDFHSNFNDRESEW